MWNRFWSKALIDDSDKCWEWQACIHVSGYGQFNTNPDIERAHRVAYKLVVGSIPEGMCVCHTCDNELCVNPNHLWIGTHADNNKDMMRKGRGRWRGVRGEENINSKLTESNVMEIRRLYGAGNYSQRQLAKRYEVARGTVADVIHRRTWKHIEEE